MAYFTPYLDDNGIHMPTYEDRLGNLIEAYRSIFGVESELDSAMPDYQLLSVFAKALDDTSALMLQAYNSEYNFDEYYDECEVSETLWSELCKQICDEEQQDECSIDDLYACELCQRKLLPPSILGMAKQSVIDNDETL